MGLKKFLGWTGSLAAGTVAIAELARPAIDALDKFAIGTTPEAQAEMISKYGHVFAPVMNYLPEIAVAGTIAASLMRIGYKLRGD